MCITNLRRIDEKKSFVTVDIGQVFSWRIEDSFFENTIVSYCWNKTFKVYFAC